MTLCINGNLQEKRKKRREKERGEGERGREKGREIKRGKSVEGHHARRP